MRHLLSVPALLLALALGVAQEPAAAKPSGAARLVEQLGSPDFLEREAASKRLDELGAAVVEELRAGAKSDNPETARRSQELLRRAERRLVNDKILAPSLVQLDAKDQPLDTVLAELSKQVKCEIVVGGVKPEDLASKKVTVATNGKVAFWDAVLKVCDAADAQVAGVGGYVAPGAMPYLGRAKPGVRVAADRNRAVVLEARDGAPKRPFAVSGAVLVEAVPFPKNVLPLSTPHPTALLQAWPEPRLQWEGTTAIKVTRATDAAGGKLAPEFTPVPTGDVRAAGTGTVLIRNADGSVTVVRDTGSAFELPGGFRPNVRQAVVRFKQPEKPAAAAKELGASLYATVRTGVEPLCEVRGLEAGKTATGTGAGGTEVSVTYSTDVRGRTVASVRLAYDMKAVRAATVDDDLPGAKGGPGSGNHTVYGLRVTDAAGKPYTLGLSSGANQIDPDAKRQVFRLEVELHREKEGHGPPAVVSFWGTQARAVEVPLVLTDVPLVGGK
ncbi:Uncharacterized protein OS=Isosphaera pallida (strain ATCC 43644 / DSM 9630 / IS1B) GN=Isop_3205 PE=4 SV=1 [Gemmataceae bacterium]|nr:Uncharacterized protein OS=Isosphaera pallida (strain ATCC 43644 / DSM 9630 / IS1B) GN=Isop_3205 PE=4 SV=1 [Gemmataceae bacterium]VTT96619.1 Uncharacterized protein OS=Isosphaera pallida (strain ATCC 43644 / DSM 9630 / IS1B) GN=Isop_3205 PE=4 SV=1 [Gemmataceae bacterium]